MANYYKTTDAWEAVALAAAQNEGKDYDPTTIRYVSIKDYTGTYYVKRAENIDHLGVPFVDYDTMALDFPPIEQ